MISLCKRIVIVVKPRARCWARLLTSDPSILERPKKMADWPLGRLSNWDPAIAPVEKLLVDEINVDRVLLSTHWYIPQSVTRERSSDRFSKTGRRVIDWL